MFCKVTHLLSELSMSVLCGQTVANGTVSIRWHVKCLCFLECKMNSTKQHRTLTSLLFAETLWKKKKSFQTTAHDSNTPASSHL